MVRGGRGVSALFVVLLGLAATGIAYAGLRIYTGHGGTLPQPSWGALVVLVFMSGGVFFAGLPVRRFLRGEAKKSLNPIRAMRTLVLAQAAALTGALVAGWYLAQVLVLVPLFDLDAFRSLALRLVVLGAGGVLLSIAGLVTQAMCRVGGPDDHPDDEDERDNINDDGRHLR